MGIRLAISAALIAGPLAAQTVEVPKMTCLGNQSAFGFSLEIDAPNAVFSYNGTVAMTIPQSSTVENGVWPKALTLISGRGMDTAVVVLDKAQCERRDASTAAFRAHVLTQRGQTPVLLTGCCSLVD